jgi:putative nucleotidyltransferase with HDIG domain
LPRHPLLDEATYQRESQEGFSREVELRITDPSPDTISVDRTALVSIKDERQLTETMRRLAEDAGFSEPALTVVVARLTTNPQPTYTFDQTVTAERQKAEADRVRTAHITIAQAQPIYKRGDVLNEQQLELHRRELAAFARSAAPFTLWLRSMSVFGAVAAIAMAVAGYLALFCPRVHNHPARTAGVAGLLAGALALACVGTVANPAILTLTAIAPTVFVSVIMVIAYEQRMALALGTLHGVLVCIALDQAIGLYSLILTGVSFAVFQLREIRDRHGIIRMGLYCGAALAVGTMVVALIDRPIVTGALHQAMVDAGLAGAGGLSVGVLTLALLPTIERSFDITTGLTLIELRDSKHPLLKQLQQRAPGTYNHSLNVASIAEAAAEAIGADSLLTYVGALYHDVGKMNKPEYFVENQSGGPNKHDKLSPAMSLLIIVGHVKDGLAMAQEAGLPESIQHFIEAHHGTTLVEFFYNRARKVAEQTAAKAGTVAEDLPEEIEYRYPGPKPRTKEAAILMLADAVESATRTMVEPTPSRIDALVRALANKRLMDGQFDECELTLKDLQTISESISKSVASIYHGRVLYPSTAGLAEAVEKRA